MYQHKHPKADGERAMAGMTLRMADGGFFSKLKPNFLKSGNERFAEAQAQAKTTSTPAQRPTMAPVTAGTRFDPSVALRQREAAAGLRDGGELRMQSGGTIPMLPPKEQTPIPDFMRRNQFKDGGEVPGEGEGDKVPALYEPGEFVVSNDMLDDVPSLRGRLHELREGTLAKRGKTVAQADEAAYSGGHEQTQNGQDDGPQRLDDSAGRVRGNRGDRSRSDPPVSLRLASGGDWSFDPATKSWTESAKLSDSRSLVPVAGPKPIPAPLPMSPSAAPAGPSTASKFFGSADEWKNVGTRAAATGEKFANAAQESLRNTGTLTAGGGNAATRFLGAAARKLGPVGGLAEAAYGASQGDTGRVLGGAGDATASMLLATPAAPAAGLYLAGRAGQQLGGAAYDALPQDTQNTIGGTVNNTLRSIPFVGKYLGVDGDRIAQANAEASGPTPGLPGYSPKLTPADGAPTLRSPSATAAPTFTAPDPSTRSLRQGNYTVPAGEFGPEDGIVYRSGNSFSGRNISGYEGNGKNPVGVIPGVSQAVIDRDLTNPDGSRWSAADNATMAANIRDGVDPYLGTSRQAGQDRARADANIERLALSEAGTPGRRAAMKILADREQNATTLRGQDITASGQAQTARNAAASAAALKAQQDRQYELDVAKFGQEAANKKRDDKRAGDAAFDTRIKGLVGDDADGTKAAGIRTAANAFLANKQAEMEAALKADPNNKRAAAILKDIQENGVSGMDEDTLRNLTLGTKANQLAQENDSAWWNPFGGTAKNTSTPVTSLRQQKNMIFPNQDITDNGQIIPSRVVEENPDLLRLRR